VIERGKNPGFTIEPRETLGIHSEPLEEHLQRNVTIQLGVSGAIDLPHPAGPDGRVDLIRAEASAGREGHVPQAQQP
jgi:hypothetical protein